jgi:hypothetical protein
MMAKGCSNMGESMGRAALLLIFLVSILLPQANASEIPSDATSGQSLTLNVYLDSSGKALITGYAESISGLDFLQGSQFQLENDSHQLYALTAGLTAKEGDLWTLHFDSRGDFDDYRVTFYLPSETSLGEINISHGLSYLLSASNESLVADVQGWDLSDPRISIQYRQPLASNGNSQLLLPPPGYPGQGTALTVLIIAAALMIAGFGLAIFLQKKRRSPHGRVKPAAIKPEGGDMDYEEGPYSAEKETSAQSDESRGWKETSPVPSSAQAPSMQHVSDPEDSSPGDMAIPGREEEAASNSIESAPDDTVSTAPTTPSDSDAPSRSQEYAALSAPSLPQDSKRDEDDAAQPSSQEESGAMPPEKKIAVTSEMEAVMQTLTARENAVMNTLITHGGRMTQAEIRYETGTPKSSLTGILISLERRKLVIKKEWGRTNIIELSEWFLSKKERS